MRYFLWLFLTALLQAQTLEETQRLSADMAQGNHLVNQAWGFAIDAPDDWIWHGFIGSNDAFAAIDPWGNGRVYLNLDPQRGIAQPLGSEIDAVIRNTIRLHERRKYQIFEKKYAKVPGTMEAYTVTFKAQDELGNPIYIHHYIFRAVDLFRLWCITEKETEPAYLLPMVGSFKLLDATGAPTPGTSPAPDHAGDMVADGSADRGKADAAARKKKLYNKIAPVFWLIVYLAVWGLAAACALALRKMGQEVIATKLPLVVLGLTALGCPIVVMVLSHNNKVLVTSCLFPGLLVTAVAGWRARSAQGSGPAAPGKALQRAEQLRRGGKLHEALEILREATASDPAPELWSRYYETALQAGADEDTYAGARMLIARAVREQDAQTANHLWLETALRAPGVLLPHALANQVAALLQAQGRADQAATLLGEYLGRATAPTPSALLDSIELLTDMDPLEAQVHLRRALNISQLTVRDEQRRQALRARLLDEGEAQGTARQAAAPRGGLVVTPATPVQVTADGVVLAFAGAGQKQLPYARINRLAAAVLRDDARPYLVMDLVLSDPSEAGVRLVRLDSRGFKPDTLLGETAKGKAGYQKLAAALLRGGARPVPDQQAVMGNPYPAYEDAQTMAEATYGMS